MRQGTSGEGGGARPWETGNILERTAGPLTCTGTLLSASQLDVCTIPVMISPQPPRHCFGLPAPLGGQATSCGEITAVSDYTKYAKKYESKLLIGRRFAVVFNPFTSPPPTHPLQVPNCHLSEACANQSLPLPMIATMRMSH